MKNNKIKLIGAIVAIIVIIGIIYILSNKTEGNDPNKVDITATFYPQYIALMNLTQGIEDVNIYLLNEKHVGCLHNYSLTTKDMKKLENSDIIVLNGAEMEKTMTDFIDKLDTYKIDSSEGISLIEGEDEINAHTFLSIYDYMEQVTNIADQLIAYDSKNADSYSSNLELYLQKLNVLKQYADIKLSSISNKNVIMSHSSFDYFAKDYNLNVVATLTSDEEETLSANKLQEIVELAKKEDVKAIFNEENSGKDAAQTVANELNMKVYELDNITGGDLTYNAYQDKMTKNIDLIVEALTNE